MKKNNIFNHEIRESVQAHAAMNCLRNRNSKRQINESACGSQEQEESLVDEFDERFKYDRRIREMANDITKEAYMIIRNEYGDGMWRQLFMDDCDEKGIVSQINDYQKYYGITNPQDIVDCMLGKKSVKSFKSSHEEQEEVRSSLPAQYEEFVLPDVCDMVVDKGISEEEVKARLLKSPKLPWEYDEIEEWVAKNFPEEQEEVKLSESEIEELTFKLADYLMESFIVLEDEDEDYSNLLEAVEKILRKDAPKSDTVAGYYAWCRKWFMKIEDLTYSYYNEPNPLSYYEEQEEKVQGEVMERIINDGLGFWDVWEMWKRGEATKIELEVAGVLLELFETLMYTGQGEILGKVDSGEIDKRILKRVIVDVLLEQDVDTFPSGESEYNSWVNEHNSEIVERLEAKFNEEEEEYDMTPSYQAYYSQDEPDYENDHHGIWLIINIMRKNGMLRAQGIEGRDDVDDGLAINAAYDLIEQKLDEEGMWIGDDDHEAERFVSFFGEEIAEEAMKSAIHNQKVDDMEGSRKEYYSQDEPDYDDDSHGIRLILNMLMKRGDITKNDVPRVQKQIKSMLDAEGMWIGDDDNEAERFIEMYWDNQEQEESPNEKYAIAKQVMANYNPDTDEWEDPSVWILYAIQDRIGKQFLKMPKKEVKAWKKAIDATLNEYEFEKQHPAHYEDEASLQSQLANAWDEGIEDEDDYVPYNNTFDETHHDIVDSILDEVHRYFQFETDVEGFNLTDYTDEQIGKALEQILDKTGDFPASVNENVCYAWVRKYAGEIIKALENGSLENPYEGHPEFDFSEQEELPSMERRDIILALAEYMSESWIDTGDDGDLDDIYYAIADILDRTGDYPASTSWEDCKPWCQKHYREVEAKIY